MPRDDSSIADASAARESITETAVFGRGETRRLATDDLDDGPSVDSEARTFAPDQVVADRYQIVSFIARGGAGEVYEVEDLALGGRVALKTVRLDRGAGPLTIERFKREVQLARQVTHPHVCRLYEYGQHLAGGPEGQKVLFLTMELCAGPTLEERIRSEGPMALDEALVLARQIASGLEAAHRAGVVHRDFKSSNVMLVPSADEPFDVRAVITDFGLARGRVAGGDPRLTRPHRIVGTPAYMAPEQVRGEDATAASDIYALGVVLFEMLTASLPFEGQTAMETAILRLTTPPPAPRARRPDLEPTWDRVVLRCMEREPSDRFERPSDVVAALEAGGTGAGASDEAEWLRPMLLALGLTLALIAVVWWLFGRVDAYHTRSLGSDPRAGSESGSGPGFEGGAGSEPALAVARPSIAVLDFRNRSERSEDAWLSTALAEMLAMEVGAGDQLRVVSGTDVARVTEELGVATLGVGATAPDAAVLQPMATSLGADLLVLGSYVAAGRGDAREVRLDVSVTSSAGEVVGRFSERAQTSRLLDLVEAAGRALREICGVGALSAEEVEAARAGLPEGAEAARLFAEGVEALHLHRHQMALDKLQRAVELEPKNPLFRSTLAEAWLALGYRRPAADEARHAVELAGGLSPRDRAEVEARWHVLEGRLEEAAEDYAALWAEAPDDPEIAFARIDVLSRLGRADEAREVFHSLRRLPAAAALRPRLASAEAKIARALGDAPASQRAAAESVRAARALGARLLEAEALEIEAGAWRELGESDKALAAYEAARAIYAEAGHRGATARVVGSVAKVLRRQGRLDQARALAEESRAVASEIGDQRTLKHALNTLAVIRRQQGRLYDALDIHRIELETIRRIGDVFGEQVTMTSIGTIEMRLGLLEDALSRFTEALAMSRAANNKRSIALNAGLLGEVYLAQARLDEAEALFREALSIHRASGSRRGEAFELGNLGRAAVERGELQSARELLEQSLAIRREIGERTNIARSSIELGRLELLEGRPARAEELFDEAAQELSAEAVDEIAQWARALRGQALAEQGDTETGLRLAESAREELDASESVSGRLAVDLAAARTVLAAGDEQAAAARFGAIADEALRRGFKRLSLEAAIEGAKLEAKYAAAGRDDAPVDATAGDPAGARLAGLAEEAESLGLSRLARRASAD